MKKMYKTNTLENKVMRYTPMLMMFIILGLSIGYSAFSSNLNISGIVTQVRIKKDVRVTGVSVESQNTNTCTLISDVDNSGTLTKGDKCRCLTNDDKRYNYVALNVGDTVNLVLEDSLLINKVIGDSSNGTIINSSIYNTVYFEVNEGETYTFTGFTNASGNILGAVFYDETGARLSSFYDATKTVPASVKYLARSYLKTNEVVKIESSSAINNSILNIPKDQISIIGSTTYVDYNVSNIQAGLILPNQDSSVTLKVEITNIGNAEVGIKEITGLPDNLDYELLDYKLKDKICVDNVCKNGITKEIILKIKYKENGFDSSNTEYNVVADIDFQEFYTITYTDITNNNYPTEILSTDTLTVDFGDDALPGVKVKINDVVTSNYTYSNGILTIPEVNGNVEIIKNEPVNLVQHITDLYNSSTLTNSLSVDGVTYKLNSQEGLMDDRLGGTVESGGNIRYYGATPNNYIDIGDRDSSGNIILWRIIGVFKDMQITDEEGNVTGKEDLVKIIRADSIGDFSWDYKLTTSGTSSKTNSIVLNPSTPTYTALNNWSDATLKSVLNPSTPTYTALNNWSDATLKSVLNGAYYNSTTTSYYNNSATATTVDFTSIGLSPNARNRVQSVVWNLGGFSSSEGYANDMYGYERGTTRYGSHPTEWGGKIALMYLSDYGYATDLGSCNQELTNYDSETSRSACQVNDWLNNNKIQWTLTPISRDSNGVYIVQVIAALYALESYNIVNVRPVLYLKSNTILTGGSGVVTDTINDPYVIDVLDNKAIITFTIGGIEYQAYEGMTWGEWAESDFDINDEYFVLGYMIKTSNGSSVSTNSMEVINEGQNYYSNGQHSSGSA